MLVCKVLWGRFRVQIGTRRKLNRENLTQSSQMMTKLIVLRESLSRASAATREPETARHLAGLVLQVERMVVLERGDVARQRLEGAIIDFDTVRFTPERTA